MTNLTRPTDPRLRNIGSSALLRRLATVLAITTHSAAMAGRGRRSGRRGRRRDTGRWPPGRWGRRRTRPLRLRPPAGWPHPLAGRIDFFGRRFFVTRSQINAVTEA